MELYNRPSFIEDDPISIPHLFTKKQDIEIAGFWAAVLAWGQRKTIISKCKELFGMMDHAPHDFVLHHSEKDLIRIVKFKHRTFNGTDALYFIHYFKHFYQEHDSLEEAFTENFPPEDHIGSRLVNFHNQFFSLEDHPVRTKKHIVYAGT